jgi:hypothetical protein
MKLEQSLPIASVKEHFPMQFHEFLPALLNVPPARNGGVDLGALKAKLATRGVNSRGWRLYLDYGDEPFQTLGPSLIGMERPFGSSHNAVAWLKLLQACEMDVLPPVRLVRSIADWGIPGGRLDLLPPLLLRAAWKACIAAQYSGKLLCDFVVSEIVPVARRFFESGDYRYANPQLLKAGWSALSERYFPKPDQPKPPPISIWRPPVRMVEWECFRFEALDSVNGLITEGRTMHHCIGNYGDKLNQSMLIAYSVRDRKDKMRVATMTVGEVCPGRWEIHDIKGPHNQDVPAEVEHAAYAVIRALEDAYVESESLRNHIDERRASLLAATFSSDADEEYFDDILDMDF